jgi:hypothetical protein
MIVMKDSQECKLQDKDSVELKELKRKNRRRNAFWVLIALQAGSLAVSYYLGRSHKSCQSGVKVVK